MAGSVSAERSLYRQSGERGGQPGGRVVDPVSLRAGVVEDGWLKLGGGAERVVRLRRSWAGKLFAVGSLISACFLGSYTGVLLSTSNQPVWANTTWLGALFRPPADYPP